MVTKITNLYHRNEKIWMKRSKLDLKVKYALYYMMEILNIIHNTYT